MDRKEFLRTAGRAGVACCGLSLLPRPLVAGEAPSAAKAPVTPDARKVEWAKTWTKRFFDILDLELDEPTRRRIMERNGHACHQGSLKGEKPPRVTLEQLVKGIAEFNGADSVRLEGNTVYFNYVKNPEGLRVADGYCLCPLVEDGPPGLSKTFCYCSVGYVRDMFESMTGRKAKVELLESLKGGGKTCRFRVDMLT